MPYTIYVQGDRPSLYLLILSRHKNDSAVNRKYRKINKRTKSDKFSGFYL